MRVSGPEDVITLDAASVRPLTPLRTSGSASRSQSKRRDDVEEKKTRPNANGVPIPPVVLSDDAPPYRVPTVPSRAAPRSARPKGRCGFSVTRFYHVGTAVVYRESGVRTERNGRRAIAARSAFAWLL